MIKDNQHAFNRLHVVLDGLVVDCLLMHLPGG